MIYEHSIDIDEVHENLIKAILISAENGDFDAIYVQKYNYKNELWSFSFSDKYMGIKIFDKQTEENFLEKFKNEESTKEIYELAKELAASIESNWVESKTTDVLTVTYHNFYDYHGVNEHDFH